MQFTFKKIIVSCLWCYRQVKKGNIYAFLELEMNGIHKQNVNLRISETAATKPTVRGWADISEPEALKGLLSRRGRRIGSSPETKSPPEIKELGKQKLKL